LDVAIFVGVAYGHEAAVISWPPVGGATWIVDTVAELVDLAAAEAVTALPEIPSVVDDLHRGIVDHVDDGHPDGGFFGGDDDHAIDALGAIERGAVGAFE